MSAVILAFPRPSRIFTRANQLAKAIVDIATCDEQPEMKTTLRARKAGTAGGPARARALTPEQRSEIAREAASAR